MKHYPTRLPAGSGVARIRTSIYALLTMQAFACGGITVEEQVAQQSQALVDTSVCPAGKNIIVGTDADDHLVGTNAADCILGLGGHDTIEGGNGDDWLIGGPGDDHLIGGNGDDSIASGLGRDTVDGGNGDDHIDGADDSDVLSGGNGDDSLSGGAGNDLLTGDNGGDDLAGADGNDTIMGGNGDDRLDGGSGDDVLVGENGADRAEGFGGNDILVGGNGPDTIRGGAGNDVIVGGNANDMVEGQDGDDACDQACCENIMPAQPHCYTNAECPAGQYCVPETGICVFCQANAVCGDANVCTKDVCQPALGCTNPPVPNGSSCDDGNACMQTDSCIDGTCTGGNPVKCVAQDQCHSAGTCDVATGVCSNPPSADGSTCDDGDACSTNDSCSSGACVPGAPLDCDDDNDCSDDSCHIGICEHVGNGTCTVPKAFVEAGGLLALEAEDFDAHFDRSNYRWEVSVDALASGNEAMIALPNDNLASIPEGSVSTSPELVFIQSMSGCARTASRSIR